MYPKSAIIAFEGTSYNSTEIKIIDPFNSRVSNSKEVNDIYSSISAGETLVIVVVIFDWPVEPPLMCGPPCHPNPAKGPHWGPGPVPEAPLPP